MVACNVRESEKEHDDDDDRVDIDFDSKTVGDNDCSRDAR